MKKLLLLIVLFGFSASYASDWPPSLVQKTYNGCMKNGGVSQCECLVTRLQHKFTFDDIKLTRTNRFAMQALKQAVQTYNVKCLDADFKKETAKLKQ